MWLQVIAGDGKKEDMTKISPDRLNTLIKNQ